MKNLNRLPFLSLTVFSILFSVVCNVEKEGKSIYVESDGLIVMQFESAPPSEGWVLETEIPGYTGNGYYRWDGKNHFNDPSHGLLKFETTISNRTE